MQIPVGVISLLLYRIVILERAHLLAVLSIEDANLLLDGVKLAFRVVKELVHRRHNRFAHHGRVEAEHDARVAVQRKNHLRVARPPEILVALELVIAASATVLLIRAEKEGTAKVNEHEHLVLLLDLHV